MSEWFNITNENNVDLSDDKKEKLAAFISAKSAPNHACSGFAGIMRGIGKP